MKVSVEGKMPVVNVKNLWKTYDGEKAVLKGVNLKVEPKEIVLIKGRSGSGKTTLLNLIGCIDAASKGNIFLNGCDISTLSKKELAEIRLKKIGIVFQSHNLINDLTVFENVLLPLKIAKNRDGENRVNELLHTFDLHNLARKKPNEISSGERQRVAIARALANNPTILLADEPTASLDIDNCDVVMNTFKKVNDEFGATVIIASHDPLVDKHVQRKYHLYNGKLTEDEL